MGVLIWLGIPFILMLAGNDLIEFVRTNDNMNRKELAEAAGYVRTTKSGKQQILTKLFTDALLSAKGTPLQLGKAPGKTVAFVTTVHANGVVLIGRTYIEKFGLKAGDELDIVLDENAIRLVPVPYEDEEVAEPVATKAKA